MDKWKVPLVAMVVGAAIALFASMRANRPEPCVEDYPVKQVAKDDKSRVFRFYDKRARQTIYFTVFESQMNNVSTVIKNVPEGREELDTEEGK